ncbi:MAG: hypothetical protein IT336_07240 [Thermomicrobiales bacterium]|nr:hypothetical protein [Thermomicrobiales bacterium]
MIGETLLIAAVVMIVGHFFGGWYGAAEPVTARGLPDGPTAKDIEAFTAAAAVFFGLALTGWRVVHGSLTIFAGALVFGITLPELLPMALIFAGIGAINFGAWFVGVVRDFQRTRRNEYEAELNQEERHQMRKLSKAGGPQHIAGVG